MCRLLLTIFSGLALGLGFEQSFSDSLFPPSNWLVVNLDSGVRKWQRLEIGYRSEPGCAYCGWEGYYRRNNDWLITPRCSVRAGDRFAFWYRAQDERYYESLEVWISRNSPRMGDFELLAGWGTNSVFYRRQEFDLASYAGQKVFFAIVYRSRNQYGVMIDDVEGPEVWSPVHDVAIAAITAPARNLRVGSIFTPSCRVQNRTGSPELVPVSFSIPGLWNDDTLITLGSFDSALVVFPPVAVWLPDTYQIVFATRLAGDQCWWNDTLIQDFVVSPFYSRGGPDSVNYGYCWFDSDDPLGPEFNWLEISSSGNPIGRGDDTIYQVNLSRPFNFYGQEYSMCWVSTNGWLAFGPPRPVNSADSNLSIPNPAAPRSLLAPFWDDLWTRGGEGGIWWQDFGDTLLVFEWRNWGSRGMEICSLSFQVQLFRSGAFEFHYANVDAGDIRYNQGMSATVGIQDRSGSVGIQYLYNGSPPGNLLLSGRAVRFIPFRTGIEEGSGLSFSTDFLVIPVSRNRFLIRLFPRDYSGAELVVYDAAGRFVRRLFEGRVASAGLNLFWDGTDESGCAVRSGVYFIKVLTGNRQITAKAVIAR